MFDVEKFNKGLKDWFCESYTYRVGETNISVQSMMEFTTIKLREVRTHDEGAEAEFVPVWLGENEVIKWCKNAIASRLPNTEARYFARVYPYINVVDDVGEYTGETYPNYILRMRIYVLE